MPSQKNTKPYQSYDFKVLYFFEISKQIMAFNNSTNKIKISKL
jgi:hypothetical protein